MNAMRACVRAVRTFYAYNCSTSFVQIRKLQKPQFIEIFEQRAEHSSLFDNYS